MLPQVTQDARTLPLAFLSCGRVGDHVSIRPFPRGTSAILLELVSHPVCFLFFSVACSSSLWTINAVFSRVAGKRLNLRHFPEMLLHLHLQLVSLHACSNLWHNFSAFIVLISSGFTHVSTRTGTHHLAGLGLLSMLQSSKFCYVVPKTLWSHIVPLTFAAVKSTANPSRSPNLFACDTNLG